MPSREINLCYPADPKIVQQIESVSTSQLRRHVTEIVIDHPNRRWSPDETSKYSWPVDLPLNDFKLVFSFLPRFISLNALTLKNLPIMVDCSPLSLLTSLRSFTLVIDEQKHKIEMAGLSEIQLLLDSIEKGKSGTTLSQHRVQLLHMQGQMKRIAEIPQLERFSLYHGLYFDLDYTRIWMQLMIHNLEYRTISAVEFPRTVQFHNLVYSTFQGGDLALLSRLFPGQRFVELPLDVFFIQHDIEHLRNFKRLEMIEFCVRDRYDQLDLLISRHPSLLEDTLLWCHSLMRLSFNAITFECTEDWESLFTYLHVLSQLTFDSTRQPSLLQRLTQSPATCRKLTSLTLRGTRLLTSSFSLLTHLTSLTELLYPAASAPAFEAMAAFDDLKSGHTSSSSSTLLPSSLRRLVIECYEAQGYPRKLQHFEYTSTVY